MVWGAQNGWDVMEEEELSILLLPQRTCPEVQTGNWSRSGYLVRTLASPSLPSYYLDPIALQGSEL